MANHFTSPPPTDPRVKVFFKNDAEYLYILLDVLGCDVEDGEEYFMIAVDVDRDKSVTPHTDTRFGVRHTLKGDLFRLLLTEPSVAGKVRVLTTTSEIATGFGPSFNDTTPHRIWELALKLEEIGADPGTWWGSDDRPPVVRMGLVVRSTPFEGGFVDEAPEGWNVPPGGNFADLLEISLSTQPEFPAADIGPVFFGVGFIPYGRIDWDTGHATTEDDAPLPVKNAAFGRRLGVLGNIRKLWHGYEVSRYRIWYRKDGGGEQVLRQTWSNYKRELVAGEWEDVLYSIGPDAEGIYDLPDPNDDWLTANLLLRWQTRGFGGGNGLYTVRLELLPERAGAAALQGVAAADQLLRLAIDNTQPEVDIDKVQHAGVDVERCEIVNQGPKTGFRFQITVNDPEGHLRWYRLRAHHGDPHDPAEIIAEETYDSAVHGFSWNGVSGHWVPAGAAVWQAGESCAYEFELVADARITNGYGLHVYADVGCSKYVTILVP
jgi:hypothetical protein